MIAMEIAFVVAGLLMINASFFYAILHHIMIERVNQKWPGRLSHFGQLSRFDSSVLSDFRKCYPGHVITKVALVLITIMMSCFVVIVIGVIVLSQG